MKVFVIANAFFVQSIIQKKQTFLPPWEKAGPPRH